MKKIKDGLKEKIDNPRKWMEISKEELKEKIDSHRKWMDGEDGERADLRDADLRDAGLRDAFLSDVILIGADLRDADLRDADLRGADLSGAILSGANLSNAFLSDADLSNADLSGTNMSSANLSGVNLTGAVLPKTVKVENLFTKIKTAIKDGGNLEMNYWHSCKTTHCLAGWTTTLAGEGGRVAENFAGTSWVAALIINESCPYLGCSVPNFYSTNEEATAFINECAEKEKRAI